MFLKYILYGLFFMLGGIGCSSSNSPLPTIKRADVNEVIIHMGADCDKLNPITSTGANAGYIQSQLFQPLMAKNPRTMEDDPILAKAKPQVRKIDTGLYAGGLAITYELRPEARWDDGKPITSRDVVFSLKAIKNPLVDCARLRPYYEFIDAFKAHSDNRFTFYCKNQYFLSEEISAITVLPEHIYDPQGLMRLYSIHELNDAGYTNQLKKQANIQLFAKAFNSEKYQRKKGFVVGSGPYALDHWETGKRVVLKKKKTWWGDSLASQRVPGFSNEPEKLIYEIIVDGTTALTALKDEGLDVAGVRSKDLISLQSDKRFRHLYNVSTPTSFSYSYVGLNMRDDKLKEQKTREALARLVDKDFLIDVLLYRLGTTVIGPIHPEKTYYHRALEPYGYNVEQAKQLLDEAGWVDVDGDGIRDKIINGKCIPLRLQFMYVSGSSFAEKFALLFKDDARKAGIDIQMNSLEWTVYLNRINQKQFDMYMGGWIGSSSLDDLKQLWHTDSYNGGSNYVGFGDEQTDMLIEQIRYELDPVKRHRLYKRIQEKIHQQVPYIFLFTSKNKLAIHKRYKNASTFAARPGYEVSEFSID